MEDQHMAILQCQYNKVSGTGLATPKPMSSIVMTLS